MPLLLLAVLVAAFIGAVLGPDAWIAAPADALVAVLAAGAQGATHTIAGTIGAADHPLTTLGANLAAAAAPGLLCLVLAEAVRAGRHLRRLAAALLLLVALATFAVMPADAAAVLLLLAVPVAVALAMVAGTAVLAPLAAGAAFLGTRAVVLGIDNLTAGTPATGLNALLNLGTWWLVLLLTAAAAPVACALLRLLRGRSDT